FQPDPFSKGRDDALIGRLYDPSDLLGLDEFEDDEHSPARERQVPNSNRLFLGGLERLGESAHLHRESRWQTRTKLSPPEALGLDSVRCPQLLQVRAGPELDCYCCRLVVEERDDL